MTIADSACLNRTSAWYKSASSYVSRQCWSLITESSYTTGYEKTFVTTREASECASMSVSLFLCCCPPTCEPAGTLAAKGDGSWHTVGIRNTVMQDSGVQDRSLRSWVRSFGASACSSYRCLSAYAPEFAFA